LEIFLRILEKEKGVILRDVLLNERPLVLIRECKEDERMWFHYIIRQGFNGPDMLVWERLRVATPDFDRLVEVVSKEKITTFVQKKMVALAKYKLKRDKKRDWFDQIMCTASQS